MTVTPTNICFPCNIWPTRFVHVFFVSAVTRLVKNLDILVQRQLYKLYSNGPDIILVFKTSQVVVRTFKGSAALSWDLLPVL